MTPKQKQLVYFLIVLIILLGGIVLILFGGTVRVSIGTSLIASGIVAALDLLHRRITVDDTSRSDAILKSGLTAIYDHRDLEEYRVLMHDISSRLDVSGYALRNFFESFGELLLTKARVNEKLHVRLLMVDPESPASVTRERLENHAPHTFAKAIETIRSTYAGVINVEVRLLPFDLSTMIFRIDDTMFIGPHSLSRASKATVTFQTRRHRDAWLFATFEGEFESMWQLARTV